MLTSSSAGPIRVLVAPDSFKGSIDARGAADAIAGGLRDALGDRLAVELAPMADGGEGTLDALLARAGAAERRAATVDALGRPRIARWGQLADGTAVIEAAEANGLPLVQDSPLRPLDAGSEGVGAIVRHALDAGAQRILLTVGGSASTDGGAGLLRALGARILDAEGAELPPGGGALDRVSRLDLTGLHPRARTVSWRIACDVDNPLTGPTGAAAVFGPQKGASADEVAILDRGLATWASALETATGIPVDRMPGAGAAGGIPAALHAVAGAGLVPGAELVADALELDRALEHADLLVTGEGALDGQSLRGKVVGALAERARRAGVPVVVVAGSISLDPAELAAAGIAAAVSIADGPATLDRLVADAPALIRATAHRLGALLDLGGALALRSTPRAGETAGAPDRTLKGDSS